MVAKKLIHESVLINTLRSRVISITCWLIGAVGLYSLSETRVLDSQRYAKKTI